MRLWPRQHHHGQDSITMAMRPAARGTRYIAKSAMFVSGLPLPVAITLELIPGEAYGDDGEGGEGGDGDSGEVAFEFDAHCHPQLYARGNKNAQGPPPRETLFHRSKRSWRCTTTARPLDNLQHLAQQAREGGALQHYADTKLDVMQWQGEPCAACGEALTQTGRAPPRARLGPLCGLGVCALQ